MRSPSAIRVVSLIEFHTSDDLIEFDMIAKVAFEVLEDDASLLSVSKCATELEREIQVGI